MEDDEDLALGIRLDSEDPLQTTRKRFHIPKLPNGEEYIYFCGNSLGLQPVAAKGLILEELKKWEEEGVEAHLHGKNPWFTYNEICTGPMAALVGALESEVIMMNSLTVNLHLMLTAFYRPTPTRLKILMEDSVFPSDLIAVTSHLRLRGYDPSSALVLLRPPHPELHLRDEDILTEISKNGHTYALVLFGGVNYITGQVLDMEGITRAAQGQGATVGYDLAHAVGNIPLELHKWGVDFAVWCSYKYLNGGPGGIGGVFVHERHGDDEGLLRMKGWWSKGKERRFEIDHPESHSSGAAGFQISNPPILSLASLRASLAVFEDVGGMGPFIRKSALLSSYLLGILGKIGEGKDDLFTVLIPEARRGCQVSLQFSQGALTSSEVVRRLKELGVIVDWREPNVLRVAPNPLYNSFMDVYNFGKILGKVLGKP